MVQLTVPITLKAPGNRSFFLCLVFELSMNNNYLIEPIIAAV